MIMRPAGEDPVGAVRPGPRAGRRRRRRALPLAGCPWCPAPGPPPRPSPGRRAWMLLLRDHGTMTLAEVLSYAIGYAEDGHAGAGRVAATVGRVARPLPPRVAHFGRGLPAGRRGARARLDAGQPGARRDLATTDRRGRRRSDREAGIDAALRPGARASSRRASMRSVGRTRRRTSGDPLHRHAHRGRPGVWAPTYEPPVSADFGGWTVFKAGPWSQGPVLLQQLLMLDGLDLQPGTADFVHLVTEVAKLALADREAWYGDADDVPLATLLSAAYDAERRALIGESASLRAAARHRRTAGRPRSARRFDAAAPAPIDGRRPGGRADRRRATGVTRGDTCHLDVVDRWGTMVAATPSGGWLQLIAGHPRARLPARHPAADDQARTGPPDHADPRPPPAHHALAVAGARAGGRCWPSAPPAATSRTSGSWCSCSPIVTGRPRPAGGHRRTQLPHHSLPQLLPSARGRARRGGHRGPATATAVIEDLRRRGHRGPGVRPVVAGPVVGGRPRPGDRRDVRGRQSPRDGRATRSAADAGRRPAGQTSRDRWTRQGNARPWAGDPGRVGLSSTRRAGCRARPSCRPAGGNL